MTSPNLNSQPSHPKTNLQHLSIIYFSPSHSQPIHDPTTLLQNLHPTPTKLRFPCCRLKSILSLWWPEQGLKTTNQILSLFYLMSPELPTVL